ncbi:MAG TPA: aminotransferase class I/II-fold pyridoxal phosphate-dependent enzyme [Firmicutes bacterium]|nr:aminotransferase class I/II-fold pyridoxal phosphate-dependent enzyme [Candidatus Fermentithermobacillaceae bacterium]
MRRMRIARQSVRQSTPEKAAAISSLSRDLSQERAPICEALDAYAGVTRFHMPGHRGGRGAEPGIIALLSRHAFEADVTGVPGMDDLHEPQGCIREAQELAARAFGADRTFFSVGGTTGAIQAMVLGTVGDGEKIVIPRNIHKSILGAIILSGAIPVFAQTDYDPYLGIFKGINAASLKECVERNPDAKAALLVNPTYYGSSVDLAPVAEYLHERGVVLLVDEAHGPHFRFHPRLPEPALDAGADAVAQGAHKILGALTQASYLHVKGNRIDIDRLKAMFQHLTTTSASYLLLASLDMARRQMALYGHDILEYAINLAEYLRHEVNKIPGLLSFGSETPGHLDPTKVTVTVRELGITGYKAEKFLRQRHGIQVEMSDLYNVLVIVSWGNTGAQVEKLLEGLRDLTAAVARGEVARDLASSPKSVPDLPPIPEMALTPRKAVQSPWESVPLQDATGRVSAEVVTCYPPGIPILYPGEVITGDTIAYLEVMRKLAFGISGPKDTSLETIRVVKD